MEPIFRMISSTVNAQVSTAKERAVKAQPVEEKPVEDKDKNHPVKPIMDEYIPEKKQAEDNPQIPGEQSKEDAPDKVAGANDPEKKDSDKKVEKCTGNTDRVDREIEKLKRKKKELEGQIHSETDDKKIEQLEKELAQVERELSQKDNDAYRRQHTVFY
ncbi:MAG: hypothetical protein HFG56_07420 [Lachnospiraceae bacterium]|nr:hypothetical protein [Lachnospiraceae bacterium]MCI9283102.1 hypothetical protein [Lachnospiraceae bacterium]